MHFPLTWLFLYAIAGLVFFPLSVFVYGSPKEAALFMVGLPALLVCFFLVLRLRKLHHADPTYQAGAWNFSLGELFVTVISAALLMTMARQILAGLNDGAMRIAILWVIVFATAFLVGLIHASMRSYRHKVVRIAYAVTHATMAMGFCGMGVFLLMLTISVAFLRGDDTHHLLNAIASPPNNHLGEFVLYTILRSQLFFAFPIGLIGTLIFEKFFRSPIPPAYYAPSSVPDLAARMRAKRSDTPP